MNLLQLINYCTRNAWKSDTTSQLGNKGWANYVFWQDLFGWHFKSVNKMILDGKSKEITEFELTSNVMAQNRIMKLDPISDFSEAKAWSTGMMYSYHTRIEPNYSDLYSRFLDDDNKYTENSYEYNYAVDYSPMIEPRRFLPEIYRGITLAEWITSKANESLVIKDNLFGWYDNRQHNNKTELHRILGRGRDKNAPGPLGETGDKAIFSTDPVSLKEMSDYTMYQDDIWQEMFDCVRVGSPQNFNEDFCNLLKLTKVKANTFNAKNRYKQAMDYKEKWNIYRYSVCCEVPEDGANATTFAILKGHHKMGGASNIFEYDWAEVCIIPKAAIGFVVGHQLPEGDEGTNPWDDDLIGLSGLNSRELVDGTSLGVCKIYPLVADACEDKPIPLGYLSGIIRFDTMCVGPTGCTASGITASVSWDYVKDLFTGGISAEGLTLTFHNSQYSPFLVVEKPNGGSGLNSSRRAYNLNEIMNRPILDENEYPPIVGACGGIGTRETIFWQETPVEDQDYVFNPFESRISGQQPDNVQYMVGPGINASQGNNWTDYPQAFDSMPIGSYKTVARNVGPGGTGPYIGGLDCPAIPLGHVVKLEFASFDEIYRLGIEGRHQAQHEYYPSGPKGIYYFSAENAHDGKCDGSNCTVD
tara:strand:+ start:27 stop:1952 length:1926 start_codon:yes stop_codon:yes gene_type:complete